MQETKQYLMFNSSVDLLYDTDSTSSHIECCLQAYKSNISEFIMCFNCSGRTLFMQKLWVYKDCLCTNFTFFLPAETRLNSNVKHSLPKFIQRTNWKLIVPHLVSVDLSDHATTDFLLNETRTDHDKGIHFYLRVLPFKGPDAYTRFYTCLCDEKEHLGHKSLLQILDK